jgi:hypothetical protein
MLPHERELVEHLKDQPFALIGINSDGDAEKVKEILAKNEITWRNAVDVSTDGPLATQWNVSGWPTIYVLDKDGRIRFKGPRGAEMDAAVDSLLREMGIDPPPVVEEH